MSRKMDWVKLVAMCIGNSLVFAFTLSFVDIHNEIGAGLGFLEGTIFTLWAMYYLDLP